MISINSRFLNIPISSQICKTRFEKHLACSFKNEEGHRYHCYLIAYGYFRGTRAFQNMPCKEIMRKLSYPKNKTNCPVQKLH